MVPVEQLAAWMKSARAAVAFTGAGISTESGIPDFRSPGGVWSRHQPVLFQDFVRSREARVRFWRQRVEVYKDFVQAKPNDGHLALARLEALGHLRAVITQNIDGLHQDAGSRRVIEIHGTARKIACIGCGQEYPPDDVLRRVEFGDEAPDCSACGSPLKSKTISFGQAMPILEMNQATQLSRDADLYLAIGSSLVVEPAASLPRTAKEHGARLVILTQSETPLDDWADLSIRASIGETLKGVVAKLESA